MIFVRSTVREFAAAGIAVFLVLLVITFTTQLIKLLGSAAGAAYRPTPYSSCSALRLWDIFPCCCR